MNLLTKKDLARAAAGRWHLAYLSAVGRSTMRGRAADEETYLKLIALGKNPKPDDVDAAIGNGSWTRLSCSFCRGDDFERVVAVDVTGGEYTTQLCEDCVKKMAELFRPPDPIEVRIIEAIHKFTAKYGFLPSRLDLGGEEWAEWERWLDEARAQGKAKVKYAVTNPRHYFYGAELCKHTEPGITARQ